jgi:hypothetical protein
MKDSIGLITLDTMYALLVTDLRTAALPDQIHVAAVPLING